MIKILVALLFIACSSTSNTDIPDNREKEIDNDPLRATGVLTQATDTVDVAKAELELRCEQPVDFRYNFHSRDLKRGKIKLPVGGKGCQIAITALEIEGYRYKQKAKVEYDWQRGETVVLVARKKTNKKTKIEYDPQRDETVVVIAEKKNADHHVHVKIEQQLPEVIAKKTDANQFLFKVVELQRADAIKKTTAGIALDNNVRGLAMTVEVRTDTPLIATFGYGKEFDTMPAVTMPSVNANISFSCDLGFTTVVNDRLVCGKDLYQDFQISFVEGTIDATAEGIEKICYTYPKVSLPLQNKTTLYISHDMMPKWVDNFSTIVLRSTYLDKESGSFKHGCHIYPLAPHFIGLPHENWLEPIAIPSNKMLYTQ